MSCGECYIISLYFVRCSVGVSVCLVCCVFDSVCELFGETIRNVFGCGCYFVAECYGCVQCGCFLYIFMYLNEAHSEPLLTYIPNINIFPTIQICSTFRHMVCLSQDQSKSTKFKEPNLRDQIKRTKKVTSIPTYSTSYNDRNQS